MFKQTIQQGLSQRPVHPFLRRADYFLDGQSYKFNRYDIIAVEKVVCTQVELSSH